MADRDERKANVTTDLSHKTHREPLTRERIVEAALRLMDAEGLDAVTMRRIGRELGVEAMSLYNHVEDKEDILDGICELVMSEFAFPEPAEDWAESCRRAARSWRQLLKDHPDVMRLFDEIAPRSTERGRGVPCRYGCPVPRSRPDALPSRPARTRRRTTADPSESVHPAAR